VPSAPKGKGSAELIEPSRPQLSFAEGLIQEEVGPLWEEWMRQVDTLLADREVVQIVYEALARRWPNSRTRGRPATPAEVVLRLLLLKHMRNWSYRVLEREVRADLVYRQFNSGGSAEGSRCQDPRQARHRAWPRDHRADPSSGGRHRL
jgi:IS5 family transposase